MKTKKTPSALKTIQKIHTILWNTNYSNPKIDKTIKKSKKQDKSYKIKMKNIIKFFNTPLGQQIKNITSWIDIKIIQTSLKTKWTLKIIWTTLILTVWIQKDNL